MGHGKSPCELRPVAGEESDRGGAVADDGGGVDGDAVPDWPGCGSGLYHRPPGCGGAGGSGKPPGRGLGVETGSGFGSFSEKMEREKDIQEASGSGQNIGCTSG